MSKSIAAMHVAKKQLGLDEDTYRAKLTKIVGKPSAKDMTEAERKKVLQVFRNEGFKAAPASRRSDGRAKLTGKYAAKLQALWIAGWNLGVFREREDAALVAFVKRQTGIDAIRFLHYPDDARKAIEALKSILKRDGGVMYGNTNGQEWLSSDIAKVVWAQWLILTPGVKLLDRRGFDGFVMAIVGVDTGSIGSLTGKHWQTISNALGAQIRDRKVTSG